ncbi:aldo/keto reductase [Companilactobacillus sp. HBUAS59699]|uniref:aldo/keto reductase n=1 Tax=Companilactobacillus sp. HBUAS59699 TaxID=3109358 RepID=UPI002FF10DB3
MEYVTFNDGNKMPILGYGTFQTPPLETEENVLKAIDIGYRSIDTAQVYGTESGVGSAITKSGIDRSDFFVTSKTQTQGYEDTKKGIDDSLKRFGQDYFDLMIIHWPTSESLETYRALEEAVKAGKIKSIGLSNFNSKQVDEVIRNSSIKPVIDQIETHLYWQQQKMSAYLKANNIVHESWAPLGENYGGEMMKQPDIQNLAKKYNVSPAQILLRFLTQQGIVTIPKSLNIDHIKSNFDIFGFKMTDEEIKSLQKFDTHKSIKDWPVSMRENAY